MELVNYTLNHVWEVLEEVLSKRDDICKCEQCKYDIVCMAVNRLKPNYVVNRHGSVYAKIKMLSQQNRTDILTEVIKAVDKVCANPHHLE